MERSQAWAGSRNAFRAGWAFVVAVAFVCVMAESAPAAPSASAGGRVYGNPDAQILVTYSGHLHRRTYLGSKGALKFGYVDVTLDWTATATFPSQDTFQRGVALHYTKLSGKITASGVGNPNPKAAPIVDCEATLSERTGVEKSSADQRATTLYELPTSRYRMSEYSPPLSAYMLQSTDTTPYGHDVCSLNPTLTGAVGSELWPFPEEGTPKYAAYAAAWNAYATFPGGAGPFRDHFDDEWGSPDGLQVADISSTITATTELNTPPPSVKPTPSPPPIAPKPRCVLSKTASTPLNAASATTYLTQLGATIDGLATRAKVQAWDIGGPDYREFVTRCYHIDNEIKTALNIIPPPPPPSPPPWLPDDSTLVSIDVTSSPDMVSAQSTVGQSGRYSTTLTFTRAAFAALDAGRSVTVSLNAVFRFKAKAPITATTRITLRGPKVATTPTISSVAITGSARDPSIVVHGSNLGTKPTPNPGVSPSDQPLCPVVINGNAGLDYGTSLYFNDANANFAAGRYRPSFKELDCIGLIVSKFTPTEVDFHPGSAYQQFYPKYQINDGDTIQITVNGASKTVHVKYGTAVSN